MSEEMCATYTPVDITSLRLTPRSSRSFFCADIPSLDAWLISRRYVAEPVRSGLEYGRYRKDRRLVVLYQSGSCTCQADDWEGAVRELSRLVVEAQR